MHKHQTQNFRRISPLSIAPILKKKNEDRTRWCRRPFRRFINTRFKKKKKKYFKKKWTEATFLKYTMNNSKYQCYLAACCTYHRPTYLSPSCQTASSHANKKTLNEKYLRIFWKKFRRMDQQAAKT